MDRATLPYAWSTISRCTQSWTPSVNKFRWMLEAFCLKDQQLSVVSITHRHKRAWWGSNSTGSIYCRHILQTCSQQIHNKSNRWSLSLTLSASLASTVVGVSNRRPASTSLNDGRPAEAKFLKFKKGHVNLTAPLECGAWDVLLSLPSAAYCWDLSVEECRKSTCNCQRWIRKYVVAPFYPDTVYIYAIRCMLTCDRNVTRSIWKMLGPFVTASRRTPPVLILHCHSPGVATVDTTTKMSRSQL